MSKLPAALAADGSEGGGTRQTHEACLRLIKSALQLAGARGHEVTEEMLLHIHTARKRARDEAEARRAAEEAERRRIAAIRAREKELYVSV